MGLEFGAGDTPGGDTQYLFPSGESFLQLVAPTVRNAAEILFPGSASSGAQVGAPGIQNRTQEVHALCAIYQFAAWRHERLALHALPFAPRRTYTILRHPVGQPLLALPHCCRRGRQDGARNAMGKP